MSKFKEAAEVLKRGALKYEQMMSAAKVLEEIGSLEQAATEAKAAAAKAVEERDAILKEKDVAMHLLEEARAQIKIDKNEVEIQVAGLMSAAEKKAKEIVDEATATKESMLHAAKSRADEMVAAVSDEVNELKNRKAEIEEQTRIAHDKLSVANAAAADAEKKLANVKAAIAKLAAV